MSAQGLVLAYLLENKNQVTSLNWEQAISESNSLTDQALADGSVSSGSQQQKLLWLHMDYKSERVQNWLRHDAKLPDFVVEALLAKDTRPRLLPLENGLLVILRGVNLNPGSEPDDMVSIRLWVEKQRIISLRHRRIMAIDDLKSSLENNALFHSGGEFVSQLIHSIIVRMKSPLETLSDSVEKLEDNLFIDNKIPQDEAVGETRRQIIRLKRYLTPQLEVLDALEKTSGWFSSRDKVKLRESTDTMSRFIEDLDATNERASIVQHEIENLMNKRTNQILYRLSIITTIFLPLGFITGLLGINVSGIPEAENPTAFYWVCIALALLVTVQLLVFRKMKWL